MTLYFDGSFHRTGDLNYALSIWKGRSNISPDQALKIVAAPGRTGKYAGFWDIRPGYGFPPEAHEFINVDSTSDGGLKHIDHSKPVFWGWSSMWDSDTYSTKNYGIGLGSSTYNIQNYASNTGVGTNIKSDGSLYVKINGATPRKVFQPKQYLEKGIWNDWVWEVLFRKDNTGYAKLWHKYGSDTSYQVIYEAHNVATLYYDSRVDMSSRQFRYGTYNGINQTLSFYLMDGKVGTTFSDVSYNGSTNPPPPPPPPPPDTTLEMGGFEKAILIAGGAYVLKMVLEEVKTK